MAKKRGIEFLVDDKGRKKSVLMSYQTYMELLEDIADLRTIAERRNETPVDLEVVISELPNIVEQIEDAISAGFPQSEVRIETDSYSHKVSGFLIWEGFDDLDQVDRQSQLWQVLRDRLGPDAARVSTIFTYTPREYKLLLAS